MHVMVATDGSSNAKKTASIAGQLAADGGHVTVFTVVEVPRGMLDEMRQAAANPADKKAREVGAQYRQTQAGDAEPMKWIGDDAIVERYVASKVQARTADLAAALEAAGVDFTVVGEESENEARAVLAAAKARDVDVICIGTHGLGRFDGMLGSLSTKVARLAPCSVVLVR